MTIRYYMNKYLWIAMASTIITTTRNEIDYYNWISFYGWQMYN